jgi:hypothetical protein
MAAGRTALVACGSMLACERPAQHAVGRALLAGYLAARRCSLIAAEECGAWPSGVQPENRFLDVLIPSRSERLLGPYCLEAAFLKDAK